MTARFIIALLLCHFVNPVAAWSTCEIMDGTRMDVNALKPETSRRWFALTAASALCTTVLPGHAHASTSNKVDEALEEMRLSKEKLQAVPSLLEEKEWDRVRTILKLPPVNKLWNLGDVRPLIFSF
jgi:hypothetical protein